MMRCARCFSVTYCDGECQKAHWAAHRDKCKMVAAEIADVKAKPPTLVGNDSADYDMISLRRSINAGDASAMMNLGICYQLGKGGVGVDATEAVRWYTRAVEARNPPATAFHNLANCYFCGNGVLKNLSEAVRLYRIAAEMGHSYSQFGLGMCLMRGEGVPYNPVEAIKWMKRAADAGDAGAQSKVGYALATGLGVPEDKAAAVVYYRRAAEQGDAEAMCRLAVCYSKGDGVPQDVPQSVAWMTRARDAGWPAAAKNLSKIAPLLTPAQRAAADQLLATPLRRTPAPTAPTGSGGAGTPPLTRADVLAMGTGALKRLLQGRGVDTAGVLEKSELVGLALAAIGAAPQ